MKSAVWPPDELRATTIDALTAIWMPLLALRSVRLCRLVGVGQSKTTMPFQSFVSRGSRRSGLDSRKTMPSNWKVLTSFEESSGRPAAVRALTKMPAETGSFSLAARADRLPRGRRASHAGRLAHRDPVHAELRNARCGS